MSESVEGAVRRLCEASRHDDAATRALEGYGGEILGFLHATLRDEEVAGEAFSLVGEGVWRGLPRFEWRSTLRTWMYSMARNSALKLRETESRRRARQEPLSRAEEVAAEIRSRTLAYLRTEVKDRFAALRESLDPEDRALLILRVDRGLDWNEVAQVLLPDEEVDRAAARVRKRYQLLKTQLRQRAREVGLVDGGD